MIIMDQSYSSLLAWMLLAWLATHVLFCLAKHINMIKPVIKKTLLPPGPNPLPVFGNIFSLGTKPHESLTKLAKTYGPLMTIRLGSITTVVVSSASLTKEVLRHHDSLVSSRYIIDAVRARKHYEPSMAWMPAAVGTQWKSLRKACTAHVFSRARLDASQGLRKKKVEELISYVRGSAAASVPVDVGQAAFDASLNFLSNTFFSMDLGGPNSNICKELKESVGGIMVELGKPNVGDFFPSLKGFDLQGIRGRMTIHLGKMIDIFESIINQRLGRRAKFESNTGGTDNDEDVLDALLNIALESPKEFEIRHIIHLLLDLFMGGTDTTASTIEWAMTELLRNPEKLSKARGELEQVVGNGKLVEEDDIPRLPYLQAIMKETLRLHAPGPFIPRQVDQDFELCGFTVPKNSQILINNWAIARDPSLWENPLSFEPERFLGSDEIIDFKGLHFELIPFGAGRRICPGLPLAIRMLPMILGCLIHLFDWELPAGESFESIDMDSEFGMTLQKATPLCVLPINL